jgi:hypothetical protein
MSKKKEETAKITLYYSTCNPDLEIAKLKERIAELENMNLEEFALFKHQQIYPKTPTC